ncbi:hypothetical protein KAU40_01580 [Candidatus Parcubacteria bacterium]|nr:hypothetical protein [Candidatus Parcubacteria bacterium]
MGKTLDEKSEYISLQEATEYCDYSQEYLSLRARQGKLKSVKFGRNWVTKKEWLEEYINKNGKPESRITAGLRPSFRYRYALLGSLVFILLCTGIVFGKDSIINFAEDVSENISEGLVTISIPKLSLPEISIPEISVPKISIPKVSLPKISGSEISATVSDTFNILISEINMLSNRVNENFDRGVVDVSKTIDNTFSTTAEKVLSVASIFGEGAADVSQITGQSFNLLISEINRIGKNISENYLAADELVEEKISLFGRQMTEGSQEVTDIVKSIGQNIIHPWQKMPAEKIVVEKSEKIIEKEIIVKEIIKEVEVSKITRIEPVKEITKEKVITKIDDKELKKLKTQLSIVNKELSIINTWGTDIEELRNITKKLQSRPTATYAASAPIYIASQGLQVGGTGTFASLGVSGSAGVGNLGVGGSTSLGSTSSDSLTVNATSAFKSSVTAEAGLTVGASALVIDSSGNMTTTGTISATGITTTSAGDIVAAGNLTVAGIQTFTKSPALPHTFSPWSIGVDNSNVSDASLFLNPSTTVSDANLFGIAVGDSVKFLIDAEGDVFANSLTTVGSVMMASTTVSALKVESSTILGDAGTDTIETNARFISSLIPSIDDNYDLGTEALYWKKLYLGSEISFEGATDNDHQLTISVADISADRAIAFRDASGTVILSGDTFTGDVTATLNTDGSTALAIGAGVIIETDISGDVDPTDGDFLQYDSAGTNFTWRSASETLSDIGAAATDQTMYIGTTQVAINRGSAGLTLAGITLTTPDIGAATGTSLQLSGLTASQILGTDASKNLVSLAVATYPSLTELTYVKGVTSAIQTQLGTKAPSTAPTFTTSLAINGFLDMYTTIGSEKVTNGDFTGNANDWTLAAGWAYSADTVVKNGDGVGTLYQDVSAVDKEIYKVVFTISAWSAGTVTVAVGGVSGTARGADGTYTEYITATGAGNLIFTPTTSARFTIDDILVKKVAEVAADHIAMWVDDTGAVAGKAGLHITAEDGTSHVFGNYVGIGTTDPGRTLDVLNADSVAQLRISQSDTVYSELKVTATTGDLTISTTGTGENVIITDDTLQVCAGTCPSGMISSASSGDLIVEGDVFIGENDTDFLKISGSNIEYTGAARPKRTIILTAAGAIIPSANGAAQTRIDGTNFSYYVLDFDQSADEKVYWEFVVPDSFDDSAVCKVIFYWTASGGTNGYGVSWNIKSLGRENDELLDDTLGAALEIEDALTVANDIMVSTEGDLTHGWAAGDYAVIKVYRDVDGFTGTNLDADARLLKIKIEYSVTKESD